MTTSKSGDGVKRLTYSLMLVLIVAWSLLLGPAAQAALTASLDRYAIAMGDTVRLTLRSDDESDPSTVDLAPLEGMFEVLQRSSSVRTEIINGQRTQNRELILELTPLKQGGLLIPAFEVDGKRSEALAVSVGPVPKTLSRDEVVFFEAELDRDSLYVQGQLILTLRVQQAVNLGSRAITDLAIEDAYVEALGQNSFQRTIDGRPWLVHELRYAIFPETSGELTIPAQTFSGRLASGQRSLFDTRPAGRLIRRTTDELRVPVLPRPGSYPDATWLPAQDLTIEERWSAPLDQLRIGDSVTRTITVTGEGLQGAQLPPLDELTAAGLRSYPDQPSINNVSNESGVTGLRTDNVAFVAIRDGEFEIPALTVPWWNTQTNSLEYAELPARVVRVSPAQVTDALNGLQGAAGSQAADTLGATDPASQGEQAYSVQKQNPLWPIIAAVCALGWLSTSLLWWFRSRGASSAGESGIGQTTATTPATPKGILTACAQNDPARTLHALRQWVRTLGHSGTLEQWAQTQSNAALSREIAGIEAACYSQTQSDQWNGAALAEALNATEFQKRNSRKKRSGNSSALPPLYPT
ncbi:MAG: BatD family protein [Pseudomonadota bacterium]